MRTPISLASLAAAAVGLAGLAATGGSAGASSALADDAVSALGANPGIARAADGQGFVETGTIVDADGTTHTRMDRTFGGLPVIGGDLVVHQSPGGALKGASQTLAAPIDIATKPLVTAAKAATAALAPSAVTDLITGDTDVKGKTLVVDATGASPRLAWQVITGGVQEDGTPSRLATFVDARTGKVLRTEQQVVNVDGQGQSLYSGTVPLGLTQSGSTYTLKDAARGGTYTTDVNGGTDTILCQLLQIGCKNGTVFSSPDTSFGTGANTNRESAGVDAQYGTNVTWDYFKNVHGRNGIFGNGTGSFNRVHYGQNYVNAFWDGKKMTYGDGDGVNFGPLVSLDVTGHEMSHGVTENTAGLTYSGESGGLNEATSDIFGAMVEFSAANSNDPGDYLIGEEFDLKNHAGFRRMDNPIADGKSPNCWSTGTKDLDVHYSSGVGNHFFYLLAEGSGAKTIGGVAHNSPTCNGSTVAGIGKDAAAEIWYRALTVYMTSGTTYAQARTATLNAAKDLYGAGSTQQNAVAAAWSAVSVA